MNVDNAGYARPNSAYALQRYLRGTKLVGRGLAFCFLSLFTWLAATERNWAAVVVPGHNETVYATGLPGAVAGITMDRLTGTIYFAVQSTASPLYALNRARVVTVKNNNFSVVPGHNAFYPYIATDIHYAGGFVYTCLYDGSHADLIRISVQSGEATRLHSFNNFAHECGLTVVSNKVFVSSGSGSAYAIGQYDLALNVASVTTVGGIASRTDLLYAERTGLFYVAGYGSRFYRLNLASASWVSLTSTSNESGNSQAEPEGNYIYFRTGASIRRVAVNAAVSDAPSSAFATGLNDASSNADMVFGPSSSGIGYSLYVGDGSRILEYSGFVGPRKGSMLRFQ